MQKVFSGRKHLHGTYTLYKYFEELINTQFLLLNGDNMENLYKTGRAILGYGLFCNIADQFVSIYDPSMDLASTGNVLIGISGGYFIANGVLNYLKENKILNKNSGIENIIKNQDE